MNQSGKNRIASEQVIIQSPMSVTGSTKRILRLWQLEVHPAVRWGAILPALVLLLAVAWVVTIIWTIVFGVVMVPWRLLRRGSRKRKRDDLRHRETLDAIQGR